MGLHPHFHKQMQPFLPPGFTSSVSQDALPSPGKPKLIHSLRPNSRLCNWKRLPRPLQRTATFILPKLSLAHAPLLDASVHCLSRYFSCTHFCPPPATRHKALFLSGSLPLSCISSCPIVGSLPEMKCLPPGRGRTRVKYLGSESQAC